MAEYVSSGDDTDVDEAMLVDEADDSRKEFQIKGRMVEGKDQNTDIKAGEIVVLCNFYIKENGEVLLAMPPLPPITSDVDLNNPEDYADFNDKLSSWFEYAEKKQKKTSKPVPDPKKNYVCIKCEWSFEATQKLHRHKAIHRNPGIFACQVCLTLFNHSYNLYNHWRGVCTQVSNMRTDAERNAAEVNNLRNYVLCVMGTENRAQQFHVFGGIIYIPSSWFLSNKYNVIDQHYQTTCHLCQLSVPTKFLECHGDVHRGRFRIDGRIYNDYFCHVCAKIFRYKENLLMHWRHDCPEIVNYTPEDVYLDDDELTALAWLVLQTTISHRQIKDMARNSNLMFEKWAQEHAKNHGMVNALNRYYHFPQEIWPLKLNVGIDIIRDAMPIKGDNAFNINHPKIPVHRTNLLATACPDFYATGITFNEICATQDDPANTPKTLFRVILRYTTTGSIIHTYKLNARTCPVLRPTSGEEKMTIEKYDVEVNNSFSCVKCVKRTICPSWSNETRFEKHLARCGNTRKDVSSHCCVCNKIVNLRSFTEHWLYDCIPMKKIIPDAEQRKYVDATIANNIKGSFKKLKARILIDWPKRPNEPPQTAKQQIDRVGEYNRLCFDIPDVKLAHLKRSMDRDMAKARERYEKRMNIAKNFVPTTAPIVTCPHCGGRIHYLQFFRHLENRHFYHGDWEKSKSKIDEWKSNPCADTYDLVKGIIMEMGICLEMRLLSKEQYQYQLEHNAKLDEDPVREYPQVAPAWEAESTTRPIELTEKLAVFINERNREAIVAPEPSQFLPMYYPETEIVTESVNDPENKDGDLWQDADPNITIPTVVHINPYTKEEIFGEFLEMQKQQDEIFFGDFRREALTNGLELNSITDFFRPPKEDQPIEEPDERDQSLDEYDIENEMDKSEVEEESNVDGDGDLEDDEEDEDSDDDDDDETDKSPRKGRGRQKDDVCEEDSVEGLKRRRAIRAEKRKEHIEMSKRVITPMPYNPQMFAPRQINLDPSKITQLQYLSGVVDTNKQPDRSIDTTRRPLALSLDYENVISDFRSSAQIFRDYYKKQMPGKPDGIKVSKLKKDQKDKAMNYYDLIKEHPEPQAIIDQDGNMFVGGFVLPMDQETEDLKQFFIIKDDYARQFRCYHCKDKKGEFKYMWPVEKESGLEDVYKKCQRVEFDRQINEEDRRRYAPTFEDPPNNDGDDDMDGNDNDEDPGRPGPDQPGPRSSSGGSSGGPSDESRGPGPSGPPAKTSGRPIARAVPPSTRPGHPARSAQPARSHSSSSDGEGPSNRPAATGRPRTARPARPARPLASSTPAKHTSASGSESEADQQAARDLAALGSPRRRRRTSSDHSGSPNHRRRRLTSSGSDSPAEEPMDTDAEYAEVDRQAARDLASFGPPKPFPGRPQTSSSGSGSSDDVEGAPSSSAKATGPTKERPSGPSSSATGPPTKAAGPTFKTPVGSPSKSASPVKPVKLITTKKHLATPSPSSTSSPELSYDSKIKLLAAREKEKQAAKHANANYDSDDEQSSTVRLKDKDGNRIEVLPDGTTRRLNDDKSKESAVTATPLPKTRRSTRVTEIKGGPSLAESVQSMGISDNDDDEEEERPVTTSRRSTTRKQEKAAGIVESMEGRRPNTRSNIKEDKGGSSKSGGPTTTKKTAPKRKR